MYCEKCEKEHNGTFGTGRFCSKACANSRGPRTKDIKSKISLKLKGNIPWNKGKIFNTIENRQCPVCNTLFKVKKSSNKTYCSLKCNPNCGGYREGSGHAKTGYYKGIYCGSTYELIWVIYQLDHNVSFKRFVGMLQNKTLKYIPDFIIGNTIIELKGYEDKVKVGCKTKLAEDHGFKVLVLYKSDLTKEFKWVADNYTYKNIWELYDDYKPKYEYTCNNCKTVISRHKKAKTEIVFCSRYCAGKGHKGCITKNLEH